MDIELGIQNVARTVTFSTEQSADEVTAGSLGYAIIGSETKHAVGFGNL